MSKKETLKNQILKESVRILGDEGFDGLSLRGVAKKLKVTHQAPYHYFPDKNSLLMEIKRLGFSLLNQNIEKSLSDVQGFERLYNLGLLYFDFCLQNPGYFRAMFAPTFAGEGVRVPEAEKAFNVLVGCVQHLQQGGYLKKYNPEIIAMICWTSIHGLVSLALEKYPVIGGKYDNRTLASEMMTTLHELYGQR